MKKFLPFAIVVVFFTILAPMHIAFGQQPKSETLIPVVNYRDKAKNNYETVEEIENANKNVDDELRRQAVIDNINFALGNLQSTANYPENQVSVEDYDGIIEMAQDSVTTATFTPAEAEVMGVRNGKLEFLPNPRSNYPGEKVVYVTPNMLNPEIEDYTPIPLYSMVCGNPIRLKFSKPSVPDTTPRGAVPNNSTIVRTKEEQIETILRESGESSENTTIIIVEDESTPAPDNITIVNQGSQVAAVPQYQSYCDPYASSFGFSASLSIGGGYSGGYSNGCNNCAPAQNWVMTAPAAPSVTNNYYDYSDNSTTIIDDHSVVNSNNPVTNTTTNTTTHTTTNTTTHNHTNIVLGSYNTHVDHHPGTNPPPPVGGGGPQVTPNSEPANTGNGNGTGTGTGTGTNIGGGITLGGGTGNGTFDPMYPDGNGSVDGGGKMIHLNPTANVANQASRVSSTTPKVGTTQTKSLAMQKEQASNNVQLAKDERPIKLGQSNQANLQLQNKTQIAKDERPIKLGGNVSATTPRNNEVAINQTRPANKPVQLGRGADIVKDQQQPIQLGNNNPDSRNLLANGDKPIRLGPANIAPKDMPVKNTTSAINTTSLGRPTLNENQVRNNQPTALGKPQKENIVNPKGDGRSINTQTNNNLNPTLAVNKPKVTPQNNQDVRQKQQNMRLNYGGGNPSFKSAPSAPTRGNNGGNGGGGGKRR